MCHVGTHILEVTLTTCKVMKAYVNLRVLSNIGRKSGYKRHAVEAVKSQGFPFCFLTPFGNGVFNERCFYHHALFLSLQSQSNRAIQQRMRISETWSPRKHFVFLSPPPMCFATHYYLVGDRVFKKIIKV